MYLPGRIIAKRAASPTVTLLDLCIPSLQTFKPGQWLDFRIPTADWIGGFSIASSKIQNNAIQIAVKESKTHAAAQWVTNESTTGDDILVQVGGTCVLHPDASSSPAVFVAGGIGISPLLGLYRHHVAEKRPPVTFYYSVPKQEEIVFRDELLELRRRDDGDSLTITLTQESWKGSGTVNSPTSNGVHHQVGRTMTEFLDRTLHDSSSAIYYICGPPTMQDEALAQLRRNNVPSDRLVYEKWW